ncbi:MULTISPECIES: co-chaperone YbbN [unclassified Nitratiruptor]|uniref:thioredoxin family protein n=1 Tax=unclassified Nitratiruptor TaxID=2624044 RepID=UPI001915FF23|nr:MULTISPECIES: thioredoxin family protein [unclassified Nitratiruptor]BCD60558.1 thioredoxin 1 [Nitratiruptor sp. YY08-10]BCD64489.1 thioredoxin 1 [Nitratiruptor sp. YY08-14]
MKRLQRIEEVQNAIKSNEAVLLYISAPNCNVCDVLKEKVKELFSQKFPKVVLVEVNVAEIPEISGTFNIFSAPAMLLFFDGKEFLREGRNVSLQRMQEKVQKVYDLYFS